MDSSTPKYLISRVNNIVRQNNELSRVSGEEFNLLRIAGLTADEVRVHSAILADLLNPCGSHGRGPVFLELFMKALGLPDMDISTSQIYVEKFIGQISEDYATGGRIDISIEDRKGNCIAIENKIYASYQRRQLVRYNNYCCLPRWKSSTL
ncbi:MAG: PD-(D/E)XK nuclease family protein, partial [Rikenellaceae bacterium]|nr:PD-(D/E)XK nuclease family protein [Rikenellaceae bacterium]